MAEATRIKYRDKVTVSDFSRTLSERVDAYFQGRHTSRHANAEMYFKTVLGLVLMAVVYAVIMSDRLSTLGVILMYGVFGFAQLFVAFNVSHDANHGGYSSSKRVNRFWSYTFDLVGVSSYVWRLLHNDSHHAFVNVDGQDTTLTSGEVFRFSPYDRRRSYHRYQHLYAPFIYSLSSLDWVLTKDYRWLLHPRFGNHVITRHPRRELVLLFLFKAFYCTYMLVLPLLFLSVPWYAVVLGFLLFHACMGFTIALIFQPNHFTEGSHYDVPDEDGLIGNNYIQHIFDTTLDYANRPFTNWVLGGLNLHIIHHMFPQICHVHYPALTRIVKQTAKEFDLDYRENKSVWGAFGVHLRWLRTLGCVDDPAVAS